MHVGKEMGERKSKEKERKKERNVFCYRLDVERTYRFLSNVMVNWSAEVKE